MPFQSTKTYGAERGLSACFRQWRADSHCRLLHGYALGFRIVFEADELDERNWVIDFGSLKPVKAFLEDIFDHKLVVAEDDPRLSFFRALDQGGIADVRVLPAVGCEAFALYVAGFVHRWLRDNGHTSRVRLASVECFEHEGNSALWVCR